MSKDIELRLSCIIPDEMSVDDAIRLIEDYLSEKGEVIYVSSIYEHDNSFDDLTR